MSSKTKKKDMYGILTFLFRNERYLFCTVFCEEFLVSNESHYNYTYKLKYDNYEEKLASFRQKPSLKFLYVRTHIL